MPMSPYMASTRAKIGTQLLAIPTVSVLTFDEHDRVLLVEYQDTSGAASRLSPH